MGKGLAVLTFDDDYQKKRRHLMTSKPKTFHEGMARSSKGLVMVISTCKIAILFENSAILHNPLFRVLWMELRVW